MQPRRHRILNDSLWRKADVRDQDVRSWGQPGADPTEFAEGGGGSGTEARAARAHGSLLQIDVSDVTPPDLYLMRNSLAMLTRKKSAAEDKKS